MKKGEGIIWRDRAEILEKELEKARLRYEQLPMKCFKCGNGLYHFTLHNHGPIFYTLLATCVICEAKELWDLLDLRVDKKNI